MEQKKAEYLKKSLDPNEEIYDSHEENSDESEKEAKASLFVYMLVICVCVGGFLFGYDTGGIRINQEFYLTENSNFFF